MQSNEAVYAAEFSPDGKGVVTAPARDARVWDAATGKAIGEPMKHDDEEASARFSPDGNRVVTASWDTARVWDVASVSGKETARAALVARRSHVKPDAFVGPKPH
jgi:WD40 repeat protein